MAQHAPKTPACGPCATRVRRKPGLDMSGTGFIYILMIGFMCLAAINSQANLLFGVFGLMVGILLVSYSISRVVLRKLTVRRIVPDHGVVGRPVEITYEFTNTKRYWPSLSVCLAEMDGVEGFTCQPQVYMLHAAPGMTATVPAEFVPKRRGLHELGRYQLSTSFPFGFIKRAANDSHPDKVLVLPPIARVDGRVLSLCRSAENTGATMRPRPGGDDEFYGVKEYREGDTPRRIYWKRSARTGKLVSKEMTQVAPPRLLLLVDTFLADRGLTQHVLVERAIAMAASLAAKALDEGMSVGLFAWGPEGWVGVYPTRGKRQRDDLLSILARLPMNTAHDPQQLLGACEDYLQSGTTAVLVTPRDVPVALSQRARGAMVVVSAVSPMAEAWFRFDQAVDFTTCMPPDQQPELGGGQRGREQQGKPAPVEANGKSREPATAGVL